jgi:hypothetical protein
MSKKEQEQEGLKLDASSTRTRDYLSYRANVHTYEYPTIRAPTGHPGYYLGYYHQILGIPGLKIPQVGTRYSLLVIRYSYSGATVLPLNSVARTQVTILRVGMWYVPTGGKTRRGRII